MASQLLVEEASTESPSKGSAAELDSSPGGDLVTPKEKGRKRSMEEGKVEEEKRRRVSSLERPLRERKTVERYVALSPIRASATKALEIQQGSGEKLKDIPNVAFKLSKRKTDESLRMLHKILFGRKANVQYLKRNILQFSGFVWSQNEDKDRLKVKEKLNKCNKDKLLDLSDMLDVYTLKVTTRKEDISERLMEFLESPHATREVVLSEKVKKSKKRKWGLKRTGKRALDEASMEKEKKKQKRGRKDSAEDNKEDKVKTDSVNTDDESADEGESTDAEESSDNSKSEAGDVENEDEAEMTNKLLDEEGMNEHEEHESKEHSPAERKVSRATSKKSVSSSKMNILRKSKSKVSSESKADVSKGTKRRSNITKTSKEDLSSSKNNTGGKSKIPPDSKANTSTDAKESSNLSTSKKVVPSSKKKVNTEVEPKAPSENKAGSSKESKRSSKMKKNKGPLKTVSEDNSKREASMKGDIPKKAEKKKGKSNTETASKDLTGNGSAEVESNDAQKKKGKKKDLSVVPSTEQLSAVLSEILKDVDFNVATLADIIRQLGAHFHTDLMDRKAEIKLILEELINTMTDDEDVEDGNGDDDKEADKN